MLLAGTLFHTIKTLTSDFRHFSHGSFFCHGTTTPLKNRDRKLPRYPSKSQRNHTPKNNATFLDASSIGALSYKIYGQRMAWFLSNLAWPTGWTSRWGRFQNNTSAQPQWHWNQPGTADAYRRTAHHKIAPLACDCASHVCCRHGDQTQRRWQY